MTTFKGTHIASFDATPFDTVNARSHGGALKIVRDAFELADTADGDEAIVLKVPVDAIIDDILFACDDLGAAGTANIGFHTKQADGTYVAVDADAFAVDIDVRSAAVPVTSYRFSAKGIETANQKAYELAGLTARPEYGELYISLTTDTGTTAAGTVYLKAEYTE